MPIVRRGLEQVKGTFTKREFIALLVVSVILGVLPNAPGVRGREWWVIPPLVFVAIAGCMLYSKRKPMTGGWLAIAAIVAVAVGVFLRFSR